MHKNIIKVRLCKVYKKRTNTSIKGYRNLEKRYFLSAKFQECFKMKEAFNLHFEIFQLAKIELNEV